MFFFFTLQYPLLGSTSDVCIAVDWKVGHVSTAQAWETNNKIWKMHSYLWTLSRSGRQWMWSRILHRLVREHPGWRGQPITGKRCVHRHTFTHTHSRLGVVRENHIFLKDGRPEKSPGTGWINVSFDVYIYYRLAIVPAGTVSLPALTKGPNVSDRSFQGTGAQTFALSYKNRS